MKTKKETNKQEIEFTDAENQEYFTDPDESFASYSIETDNTNTNKIPVAQQLVLLVAILFLLLGGSLTPKIFAFFQDAQKVSPAAPSYIEAVDTNVQKDTKERVIEPFSEVQIVGEAAYVWDVQAQRALFKKEDSKQLPLASVTKLMTALVAHELLSDESKVTIDDQAIRQDGDSGLLQGETFKRTTLSDLVLMSSSNDGAYAMAVAAGGLLQKDNAANAFVHAMNIRAEELNLHDTYFKNPTGLDISTEESGAYGSAKDTAFLMEYIVVHEPDLLAGTQEDQTRMYSQDGIYHDAVNTNYYIDEIPGIIGSKTGYTDLAGGNLVVAFDAGLNRPIIISVLGSTRQERFRDVMKLVEEVQHYVTQK
jgi:D-alanyl-D-alanine carboxypeptidase